MKNKRPPLNERPLAHWMNDCLVYKANEWIASHPCTPLPLGISNCFKVLPADKAALIDLACTGVPPTLDAWRREHYAEYYAKYEQ